MLILLARIAGLIFIGIGLGWWIAPTFLSAQLGMSLLDGVGRTTQVADLASFFLTLGICIHAGLVTQNRLWFYPASLLLGLAAFGRVLSWVFHDAALTIDMIGVEVLTILLLVALIKKMKSTTEKKV